jgi:flagellar operon protein (TIGR03826 family)
MGLRNCVRCGQVFASNTSKVCPQCQEEEEEDFEKVKEFVYEEGNSTILKIHEGTGVEKKRIQKFIRKGRLTELNVDLTIGCKRCGAAIKSGDYCKSCRDEMVSNLSGDKTDKREKKSKKKKSSGKMRYMERNQD